MLNSAQRNVPCPLMNNCNWNRDSICLWFYHMFWWFLYAIRQFWSSLNLNMWQPTKLKYTITPSSIIF